MPSTQLEAYFQEFGTELVTEASVLSDTAGADSVSEYQVMPIDLLALEWWHDNDVENIETEEAQAFVETVGPVEQATELGQQAMVMETIAGPLTQGRSGKQYHPAIEDSKVQVTVLASVL